MTEQRAPTDHARTAARRIGGWTPEDVERYAAVIQQAIDGAVAEALGRVSPLREALEHYADDGNWSGGVGRYPVSCVYRSRDYSGYEVARQALAAAGQEGGG